MKPAKEWLNRIGETVMQAAFCGGNPPGIEVEKLVEAIQLDAVSDFLEALREWVDDPIPCASSHKDAPDGSCDCWACERTRKAKKLLSDLATQ